MARRSSMKSLLTKSEWQTENPAHQKSTAQQAMTLANTDTHTERELFLTLMTFSHHWRLCLLLNFWQLLVSSRGLLEQDFLPSLHSVHLLTFPSFSLACSRFCCANKAQETTSLDRRKAEVRGHGILWYERWREKAGGERERVCVQIKTKSNPTHVRTAHLKHEHWRNSIPSPLLSHINPGNDSVGRPAPS